MTIRLEIAPGDHFDAVIKPFHQMTVEEYIRVCETPEPETSSPLEAAQNRLMRFTGAPARIVRIMSIKEVDSALEFIQNVIEEQARIKSQFDKVHETLGKWKEDHDGADYTVDDAREVLRQFEVFKDAIEVDGVTYTAPLVEPSAFGKWIDLNNTMAALSSNPESESYVAALSIMMEGQDGPYPSQAEGEPDREYEARCAAYTSARSSLFMRAPWVDVMGCAAFFFSKWERFAVITAHNMTRFRSLMRHTTEPVLRVIPKGGEYLPS